MIHRICVFITDSMPDQIKNSPTTREIYIYCLEHVISQIAFVLFILIFGSVCREFLTSVVLLSSLMPLRAFGGGAHASSEAKCVILSYGFCILSILLIPIVYQAVPMPLCLLIFTFCIGSIFILSPVPHRNKPLTNEKRDNLHLKCGLFIILLITLTLIFLKYGYRKYVVTVTLSVIIMFVSSIIGHIQNWRECSNGP